MVREEIGRRQGRAGGGRGHLDPNPNAPLKCDETGNKFPPVLHYYRSCQPSYAL